MSRMPVVLASAFSVVLGGIAPAQQYSDVVAFGDSLCDNGNFFEMTGIPPAPYWEGRASNGRVWVEQLANELGLDPDAISDQAVYGATTSNVFNLQVAPFVAAHGGVVPSDALYVVWAGANDFIGFFQSPGGDPAQMITEGINNLGASIGLLLASGARHVVVPNLPDLSVTPYVTGFGDAVLIGQVRAMVQAFNAGMGQLTGALEAGFGVDLIEFDSFQLLDDMVASPRSFGLKNSTELSFPGYLDGTADVVNRPDDYLFWDDVHPTRVAHNVFASRVFAALGLVWGDLDGSGGVDSRDVKILVQSFGPSTGGALSDMNADGVVDATDLQILQDARH